MLTCPISACALDQNAITSLFWYISVMLECMCLNLSPSRRCRKRYRFLKVQTGFPQRQLTFRHSYIHMLEWRFRRPILITLVLRRT